MTGVIAVIPRIQFSNALGLPMVFGTLTTYIAGSTTPADTFKDQALTVKNTNPIDLDETGSALIWLDPTKSYKFVLKNGLGVTQPGWPVDNIAGAATLQTLAPEFSLYAKFTALAAAAGASLIGFIQAGIGAVRRTVQDKERDIVSVLDFMTDAERADYRAGTLTLDLTVSYQKALTAISVMGGELFAPDGLAKITARLDVTGNNVKLLMAHNAGISYNTADGIAIKFTGQKCAIDGGLGRGFVGPAVWDGTNVAPTYAVIQFLGDGSYARTRLSNIKKVGIWFKDVIDGTAEGCFIEGNYPLAQWTGVETAHYGVLFDPSAAATAGNFKLLDSTIKSCVQGCIPANYGAGGITQGFVATGNIFEGCWNHGIYSNFTSGAVIVGNSFNRCQIPIVVSGNKNNVTGNTMYTLIATAGDQRDVTGISVRDGTGNIISNNTIKGVSIPANAVGINIQDVSGLSQLNDNIVEGNTIDITDGTCVAIRIVGSTNSVSRNIIRGNTISTLGSPNEGAISVYGLAGAVNLGNKVCGNIIKLLGSSYGVYGVNLLGSDFTQNTVEFAYDFGSAYSVVSIATSGCTDCLADGNISVVRPTFGLNMTIYGYREFNSATTNKTRNNYSHVDATKGALYYPIQSFGNDLLVDQTHIGAPTIPAMRGSRWWRTDGGAGTTFYVREDPAVATNWTAK